MMREIGEQIMFQLSYAKKNQNHSNQRTILSFLRPPAGLEPALCRQKGILSPSCLPISPQWLLNELPLQELQTAIHIIQ